MYESSDTFISVSFTKNGNNIAMIEIFDKQDEQRKLRRTYEDYLPLETSEPQPTTETGVKN